MSVPEFSSTWRKWCVNSTGTLTLLSMLAWSQDAVAKPVTKAFPHSGSYSFRSCGGPCGASAEPTGAIAARAFSIDAGSSLGIAFCSPSQSPIDHWPPSHLFHSVNIGPIPWRIDWPHDGFASDANSGASSQTAARIWLGLAKADSHAAIVPPDERPLTIAGRWMTRSMNRTRSRHHHGGRPPEPERP